MLPCLRSSGGRRTLEDIHVDKSQSDPPEVGLDWQNFKHVEVGTLSWGKKKGTEEEEVEEGLKRKAREGEKSGTVIEGSWRRTGLGRHRAPG